MTTLLQPSEEADAYWKSSASRVQWCATTPPAAAATTGPPAATTAGQDGNATSRQAYHRLL